MKNFASWLRQSKKRIAIATAVAVIAVPSAGPVLDALNVVVAAYTASTADRAPIGEEN